MSVYLDTSCLLKLFFPEPETRRVAAMIAAEPRVVVPSLAKLEALVQVQSRLEGGLLTRRAAALAPYEGPVTSVDLATVALSQVVPVGSRRHYRTLDRLHLAAMEALSLRRLLTND